MQIRKSNIIEVAKQLFIEQGYHATSIQDIINGCSISRGTFYKNFQSKSELLQAALSDAENKICLERDRILIDQDESNSEIFIDQLELMMRFRAKNKINALIDDAVISSDKEIIEFVKQIRVQLFSWIYGRFKQIFPEYQEYLADATVIFIGMLDTILAINASQSVQIPIRSVCSYCLTQVEELLESNNQKKIILFNRMDFEKTFFIQVQSDFSYNELALSTGTMKKLIEKLISDEDRQETAHDLVVFVQEEVVSDQSKTALISSALTTLMSFQEIKESPELKIYIETLKKLGFHTIEN